MKVINLPGNKSIINSNDDIGQCIIQTKDHSEKQNIAMIRQVPCMVSIFGKQDKSNLCFKEMTHKIIRHIIENIYSDYW